MKTIRILSLIAVTMIASACSKATRTGLTPSVFTATAEMERLVKLPQQDLRREFVWNIHYCDPSTPPIPLPAKDYAELRKLAGGDRFYLHRFIPKKKSEWLYEVLVSEDGQKLLGSRRMTNHYRYPAKSTE